MNTFKKALFTFTLLTGLNVTTVSASEVTTQLHINAQTLMAVTMEENLNQLVTTINGDLKKDILKTAKDEKRLVLELAASQLVKDDKITSAVGE